MESKRLHYLDYAKGIGILLMLFQHSIPQHNLWRLYTQSFVMPLFFVVGGFLLQYKEKNGKVLRLSYNYIIKRLKQIGLPYLIGSIILSFYLEFLSMSQGGHSICGNIYRIISLQGVQSMWFLPVYLFSELVFLILVNKKNIVYLYSVFSLLLLLIIVRFEGSPWPFALLEKTVLGSLFFIGGYYIASFQLIRRPILYQVLFLFLGLICSSFNGFASFAELHNPVLFFLSGFLLSAVVLYVSSLIEPNNSIVSRLLDFFGKNTLFILCTNNLIIETIRIIDYKLAGSVLLNHGMLGNFVMFLLLSVAESVMIFLYRRLLHERS